MRREDGRRRTEKEEGRRVEIGRRGAKGGGCVGVKGEMKEGGGRGLRGSVSIFFLMKEGI